MEKDLTPRPGIADRLSAMIQLPTVSAERETRGLEPFEAFEALIAELYPLVHEKLSREKITDLGLLYFWQGSDESLDPAVLMAHYDVVPVDENDDWTYPPFEGRITDGWVYGRGALDDKGPLVVVLDAVENLLASGFTPRRSVYLSFGGDEEVHGNAAKVISQTLHERGVTPWLVIDEGGAVVDPPLPFLKGDAAMIGVAEKGIATVRLSAFSQGGHASTPKGLTAVSRVTRAVNRLQPSTFASRAPEGVIRMLEAFARKAPARFAAPLRQLAAHPKVAARVLTAAGGEMPAMVRTTISPTMLSGGTAHNVLPSAASAIVNLRIALGETVESTVRRVRAQVRDPLITVELVEGSDPSPESATDNEQFALIEQAIGVSHPGTQPVPYLVMAATDSRWFHRFAPAVYRFAPLKMTAAQRATIHAVDEQVEVAELERGEVFHRSLIKGL
ncbi:MAG: M20/M25/M40 family metallo-hydrolase [Microbacteriaceae bacterium]